MSNIPGITLGNAFLIVASYILILLVNRETRSQSALLLITILTFHHIVAYLYAFYLPLPENEADPARFMFLARGCADAGYCAYIGQHLYANYLAKMLAFGQSIYFVYLLNVIFFIISLFYFIGISDFFDLKGNRKINIFLYGMWPSVVYFTTLHYREPFELYLLIAGVYFGLTGSRSDSFPRMLTSMVLLFGMGLFHIKGLIFLSPILFIILVSYRVPLSALSLGKKIILLLIMCIGVYFAQSMYVSNLRTAANSIPGASVTSKVTDITARSNNGSGKIVKREITSKKSAEVSIIDKLIKKITMYRKVILRDGVPGTAFISNISDKSIPVFFATYFIVYLEYLFSPFIFQVNSFHSLLAYAESVLRLILFASTLVMVKRNPQTRILFSIYLAITAMWAIGVISFGASIRHHIMTNWILVILGVPLISEYISRKVR